MGRVREDIPVDACRYVTGDHPLAAAEMGWEPGEDSRDPVDYETFQARYRPLSYNQRLWIIRQEMVSPITTIRGYADLFKLIDLSAAQEVSDRVGQILNFLANGGNMLSTIVVELTDSLPEDLAYEEFTERLWILRHQMITPLSVVGGCIELLYRIARSSTVQELPDNFAQMLIWMSQAEKNLRTFLFELTDGLPDVVPEIHDWSPDFIEQTAKAWQKE